MPTEELERLIRSLEEEMHEAAKDLRFEYAARLRDEVHDLRKELEGAARGGRRAGCLAARRSRGSAPGRIVRDAAGRLRGRTRHVVGPARPRPRRRRGARGRRVPDARGRRPARAHRARPTRPRCCCGASPPCATSRGRPSASSPSPTPRRRPSFNGPLIRAAGPMLTAPGGYPIAGGLGARGDGSRGDRPRRGGGDGEGARRGGRHGDQGVAERGGRADTLGRRARRDLRGGPCGRTSPSRRTRRARARSSGRWARASTSSPTRRGPSGSPTT